MSGDSVDENRKPVIDTGRPEVDQFVRLLLEKLDGLDRVKSESQLPLPHYKSVVEGELEQKVLELYRFSLERARERVRLNVTEALMNSSEFTKIKDILSSLNFVYDPPFGQTGYRLDPNSTSNKITLNFNAFDADIPEDLLEKARSNDGVEAEIAITEQHAQSAQAELLGKQAAAKLNEEGYPAKAIWKMCVINMT